MTTAEFHAALLLEQFGTPTAQWHLTVGHRAAGADRVRLCEDAMWLEQHADDAA